MSSEPATEHNKFNVSEHKVPIINASNVDIDLSRNNFHLHNNNIHTSWNVSNQDDEISIVDSCTCVNNQNMFGIISQSNENPNIGRITTENSSDITFGNKHFFNGPVVTKQFITNEKTNKEQNENIDAGSNDFKTKMWWRKPRRKYNCNNNKIIYFGVAAILAVVVVVTLVVSFLPEEGQEETTTPTPTPTPTLPPTNLYVYVNRSTWEAMPAKSHVDLKLPVKRVIVTHTVTGDCTTMKECSKILQSIQRADFKRNYSDIGLNFFVGGDSAAYEGRGYRVGAHTKAYGANSNSISIAFIGNFNNAIPLEGQLDAAKRLIDDGLESNRIHPDYKLYGQRQFFATDSPGHLLFPIIIAWPHWSAEIVEI